MTNDTVAKPAEGLAPKDRANEVRAFALMLQGLRKIAATRLRKAEQAAYERGREHEREACASIAEASAVFIREWSADDAQAKGPQWIADSIRQRGSRQ